MRTHKRIWTILLAVLLASLACCSCTAWGSKHLLNWLSFEMAWKVVADKYYDPTFGGVDWQASRARYRQQVIFASSADY